MLQTVLMLFCTDGCISVVDKRTDPLCFVFYTEKGEKTQELQAYIF